mgnify:CR=1 FL=1
MPISILFPDSVVMPSALLSADERPAWRIDRPQARSPFVLLCDHASCDIPRSLDNLGLSDGERQRHIGWDIGALALSRKLAALLDATLIAQRWSRLVIDCNRPPGTPESIVARSERTVIPGNVSVSLTERAAREREVFQPYHDTIRTTLDQRAALGVPSVLIAVHSFTPVYLDVARPWHAGLLFQRDARLAEALAADLQAHDPSLVIGLNEPYAMGDDTDHTLVVHGERRGLAHVELEIRQDLIADDAGQQAWAQRLARLLPPLLPPLLNL